jgi:hypothetical protein
MLTKSWQEQQLVRTMLQGPEWVQVLTLVLMLPEPRMVQQLQELAKLLSVMVLRLVAVLVSM